MKVIFSLFFINLFLLVSLFSQNEIHLLGGKILTGEIQSIHGDSIIFKLSKKNKPIVLETSRVYSVLDKDKKETVLYKQDSTIGNYYTVEEMRMHVYGKQDAWKGVRPKVLPALTFLVSSIGGFLIGDSFVVLAVPFATYLGSLLFSGPVVFVNTVRDPAFLESQPYLDGYATVSKTKKNSRALLGSISGTIVGVSAFQLTK